MVSVYTCIYAYIDRIIAEEGINRMGLMNIKNCAEKDAASEDCGTPVNSNRNNNTILMNFSSAHRISYFCFQYIKLCTILPSSYESGHLSGNYTTSTWNCLIIFFAYIRM